MPERPQLVADLIIESKGARDFANNFGRLLSDAAKQWRDDVKKTTGAGVEAGLAIALASGKSGSALKGFVKSNIGDVWGGFMKEMRTGNIEGAEKLERILDQRTRRFQKEADSITAAFAQMQDRQARTFTEHTDQFKNKVGFLQRGLFGGLSGFADLARGGGRFTQRMGEERMGRAGRMRELAQKKGADPKALAAATRMAKMGKLLATVGKAAAGFAAVAGAVLMLIKLFADLESKVKDMNKEIIGTSGAAEFGFTHVEVVGGKLREQLERIRSETTALNANFMAFRASAQEQQRILAGFSQAGLTYARMNEEIAEGTKFMGSYSDITALALTYARNLGMESTEITEKMGSLALETGMGLRDVSEQFSTISREAMLAGFVTKRFYAAIVEVTSGMAFYGVRIEETTKLLKTFDSLLGEAVGTETFKQLVGQYKDKGAQDRIRELILKNQGFAQEQFSKAFDRQVQQLVRRFGSKLEMGPEQIKELLGLDAQALAKELGKFNVKGAQMNEFEAARLVGQARGGGAAMELAMPYAGPGFDIAMATRATEVFGNRGVDEVLAEIEKQGDVGRGMLAALEGITSRSIPELQKTAASLSRMGAMLSNLNDIREKMVGGVPLSDQDRRILESARDGFGMYIDEATNKIMKGDFDTNRQLIKGTGIELKDKLGALTETTTLGEEQIEEQMSKDQENAQEISDNITGLTEVMEQTVVGVLNNIYDFVQKIYYAMPFTKGESVARDAAVSAARGNREELKQKLVKAKEAQADSQRALDDAKRTGDQKLIEQTQLQLDEDKKQTVAIERGQRLAQAAETRAAGLTDDEINAVGGVYNAVINATDALSEQSQFANKEQQQAFAASLEGMLPTLPEEVRGDVSLWDLTGQIKRTFAAEWLDPTEFAEDFIRGMEANPQMATSLGGMEEVRRIAQIGQTAMEALPDWTEWDWDAEEEANFAKTFATKVALEVALAQAQMGHGAVRAKDLILPARGGPPILTDATDTLFAAAPGGPIAQAMGGAGRGAISVNIYGGDQRKVYETVMRVLKATGNA